MQKICVDCGSKKTDGKTWPTLCKECRKKMKKKDNNRRCAFCGRISDNLKDISGLDGSCSDTCSSCREEMGYEKNDESNIL